VSSCILCYVSHTAPVTRVRDCHGCMPVVLPASMCRATGLCYQQQQKCQRQQHLHAVLPCTQAVLLSCLLGWLSCRWGLANAERMMVKPDHLTLDSLMSRKGYTGEVRHSSKVAKQQSSKQHRCTAHTIQRATTCSMHQQCRIQHSDLSQSSSSAQTVSSATAEAVHV
jgi:hypothetical protein